MPGEGEPGERKYGGFFCFLRTCSVCIVGMIQLTVEGGYGYTPEENKINGVFLERLVRAL